MGHFREWLNEFNAMAFLHEKKPKKMNAPNGIAWRACGIFIHHYGTVPRPTQSINGHVGLETLRERFELTENLKKTIAILPTYGMSCNAYLIFPSNTRFRMRISNAASNKKLYTTFQRSALTCRNFSRKMWGRMGRVSAAEHAVFAMLIMLLSPSKYCRIILIWSQFRGVALACTEINIHLHFCFQAAACAHECQKFSVITSGLNVNEIPCIERKQTSTVIDQFQWNVNKCMCAHWHNRLTNRWRGKFSLYGMILEIFGASRMCFTVILISCMVIGMKTALFFSHPTCANKQNSHLSIGVQFRQPTYPMKFAFSTPFHRFSSLYEWAECIDTAFSQFTCWANTKCQLGRRVQGFVNRTSSASIWKWGKVYLDCGSNGRKCQ